MPNVREDGSWDPSLRASVLVAELLDLAPGIGIHLPSPRPTWLSRIVEASGARVVDSSSTDSIDRVVVLGASAATPRAAKAAFALFVRIDPYGESARKELLGQPGATMDLGDVALREGEDPPRTIRHVLTLEGFLYRSARERAVTEQDELFLEAVESTWDPVAGRRGGLTERQRQQLKRARKLFAWAYIHQFGGDIEDAITLYTQSIREFPTAEAYTFLAWAHSFAGDVQGAVRFCRRAIAVDPGFGNPYNDLGAYLLDMNRPREALTWLDQAASAERYDSPHFAHCNRGRALLRLGRLEEARNAFRRALMISPGYEPARRGLEHLDARAGMDGDS